MSEPASVRELGPSVPRIAQAGSVSDFEALYRAEVGVVMAFFARRSRDRQAVYDLTADTFVEAMRSFGACAPTMGSERAWLFAIARRVYARYYERALRDRDAVVREIAQRSVDNDALDELIDRVDAEEAGRAMLERLAFMSPPEREAIELVDLAGLTPREAAHALGVSSGALRVRLYRARAKLRKGN